MKEFFGIGGYQRTPSGAYSLEHLLFVGSLLLAMVVLAVVLETKTGLNPRKKKPRFWFGLLF